MTEDKLDEIFQILKRNTEKAIKEQKDHPVVEGSFQFLASGFPGPIYPKTICDRILMVEEDTKSN